MAVRQCSCTAVNARYVLPAVSSGVNCQRAASSNMSAFIRWQKSPSISAWPQRLAANTPYLRKPTKLYTNSRRLRSSSTKPTTMTRAFHLPAETDLHAGTMMAWPTKRSMTVEHNQYAADDISDTRLELAGIIRARAFRA